MHLFALITLAFVLQSPAPTPSKTPSDWWTVFLTGTLALIGFLQFLVYAYQAKKLRETVESAEDQSQAMERHIGEAARSATAMENVAKTIEGGNRTIMRAYVTTLIGGAIYQERRGEGQSDLKFEGKVQVANTGNTPARKVRIRKKAAILDIPTLQAFDFALPEGDSAPSYASIGAHQNYIIESIIPDFVPDEEVATIKEGTKKALCMWGDIVYEDIFGVTHKTKFGHWLYWLPNGKVFGYYIPNQNEAD